MQLHFGELEMAMLLEWSTGDDQLSLVMLSNFFYMDTVSWWFAKLDRHPPCSMNEGSSVPLPRKKHLLHIVIHRMHLASKHWEGTVCAQHNHTVYKLIPLKSQTSLWYWLSETFLLKVNLSLFVVSIPFCEEKKRVELLNLQCKIWVQRIARKKTRIFAQGSC